jgi:hypothetical protein
MLKGRGWFLVYTKDYTLSVWKQLLQITDQQWHYGFPHVAASRPELRLSTHTQHLKGQSVVSKGASVSLRFLRSTWVFTEVQASKIGARQCKVFISCMGGTQEEVETTEDCPAFRLVQRVQLPPTRCLLVFTFLSCILQTYPQYIYPNISPINCHQKNSRCVSPPSPHEDPWDYGLSGTAHDTDDTFAQWGASGDARVAMEPFCGDIMGM